MENPSTLYITGPATQQQKASTIISFTGAVCLRTISIALGEEESADECSCLLSAQSRGKGAHSCNNFEREVRGDGGMPQVANDKTTLRSRSDAYIPANSVFNLNQYICKDSKGCLC